MLGSLTAVVLVGPAMSDAGINIWVPSCGIKRVKSLTLAFLRPCPLSGKSLCGL